VVEEMENKVGWGTDNISDRIIATKWKRVLRGAAVEMRKLGGREEWDQKVMERTIDE
jgi:hypothetical protein